jgi:effector-binding domain-containing protein
MYTHQLTPENKAQEKAIINQILTNNGYQQQIAHQKHKRNPTDTKQKMKWSIFTYNGPDTRTITTLFCRTYLKIAYKTVNSIKHHFKIKNQTTYVQ